MGGVGAEWGVWVMHSYGQGWVLAAGMKLHVTHLCPPRALP